MAYSKEYYKNNKEKVAGYNKKWRDAHKDQIKESRHKYYLEHKEEAYKNCEKWRNNNKEKFANSVSNSRKKRAERLREQGCINPWNVIVNGVKPKYKEQEK